MVLDVQFYNVLVSPTPPGCLLDARSHQKLLRMGSHPALSQ
jgi:hypothetical protein